MKAIRSKKLAAVGGAERAQGQYNKYVTKYKRTKNLVKKCTDIAKQCDLDIILLIRDKNTDRCREFHTNPALTVDDFIKKLDANDGQSRHKYERIHAKADGEEAEDGIFVKNKVAQAAQAVQPAPAEVSVKFDETVDSGSIDTAQKKPVVIKSWSSIKKCDND